MNNKKGHLISIITPAYNASKYIQYTIQSVKSQTYKNWELIIVDDCSQDNTIEIIKKEQLGWNNIKLIELDNNQGAAIARNTAIKNAGGRFIAFLDSDDLWYPQKLEEQLKFMLKNDYAFTFTSYGVINEEGKKTNKIIEVPARIMYEDLLKNTIIGCLTVMIDREKIKDIKMPNIRAGQDTALWLSILRQGNIAYGLNKELSLYRKVKGSISSNKLKAIKRTWRIYRELEKLNLFKSSWYQINYMYNALKKHL